MNILNHYVITLSSTALAMGVLGIFIFFKDPKKKVNWTFALFTASAAIWSGCEAYSIIAPDKTTALFWWRISHIGVIFIPVFFLHFVFSLLEIKGKKRKLVPVVYISSLIFLVFDFTPLLIREAVPKFSFKYFINPGIIYPIFLFFWITWVICAIFELFKAYLNSSGIKRNQLKYLAWGTVIGYGGAIGNYLPLFNIELYPYNPFGTYGVPIYSLMVAYAIVAHHLMDINIIIRKGLIYSFLVSSITIVYFIAIFFSEKFCRGLIGYQSILAAIFTISLIALIFQPLKNKIQTFVDRVFFKGTREEIARENERLKEEIQKSEKLKAVGTLAAGMAHEIKNPLSSIKTFTDYLSEKRNDDAFIEKFQKIVGSEIDRINSIIHELLNFARPSIPKFKPVDIHTVLNDTLDLINNDLTMKSIELKKEYAPQIPSILADPGQLEQVFLNLFLNSLEAMERGGVLTIVTVVEESHLIIKISDTGKGIAKEDLPHLFDPFYTTKKHGTGLGLSIVYGIIKKHKGSIAVENKPNQGSTFIISLPIKS